MPDVFDLMALQEKAGSHVALPKLRVPDCSCAPGAVCAQAASEMKKIVKNKATNRMGLPLQKKTVHVSQNSLTKQAYDPDS